VQVVQHVVKSNYPTVVDGVQVDEGRETVFTDTVQKKEVSEEEQTWWNKLIHGDDKVETTRTITEEVWPSIDQV